MSRFHFLDFLLLWTTGLLKDKKPFDNIFKELEKEIKHALMYGSYVLTSKIYRRKSV